MKKALSTITTWLLFIPLLLSQEVKTYNDTILTYKFNSQTDSVPFSMEVNTIGYSGNRISYEYSHWNTAVEKWIGTNKWEGTYDANGNQNLEINYMWDAIAGEWVGTIKHEYTYDLNGGLVLDLTYKWDLVLHDWVGDIKWEYAYDSNGNKTLQILYIWDAVNDDWARDRKSEYAYDSNGNKTLSINSGWDSEKEDWVQSSKREYTYDLHDNIILNLWYQWKSGISEWVLGGKNKDVYSYDSNGNQTLNISYNWDSEISNWVEQGKIERTFDSNSNQTSEVLYIWDPATGGWLTGLKNEITYDSNGYPTVKIDYDGYYYNSFINDWFRNKKWEFTYDSYGNETLNAEYYWDPNINDFILDFKTYYQNDGYYFSESESICSNDSILWHGKNLKSEGTYSANYRTVSGRDSIYEITLTYSPKPTSFDIDGQHEVDEFEQVTYSVPNNPEITYKWFIENGTILSLPADNSSEIQWGDAAYGYVKVIAENHQGCHSDTAELEVIIGTTAFETLELNGIKVYPNPTENHIFIHTCRYAGTNGYQLKIVNNLGVTVFESKVEEPLFEVNLSDWTKNGIYYIQLIDAVGSIIENKKIILQ